MLSNERFNFRWRPCLIPKVTISTSFSEKQALLFVLHFVCPYSAWFIWAFLHCFKFTKFYQSFLSLCFPTVHPFPWFLTPKLFLSALLSSCTSPLLSGFSHPLYFISWTVPCFLLSHPTKRLHQQSIYPINRNLDLGLFGKVKLQKTFEFLNGHLWRIVDFFWNQVGDVPSKVQNNVTLLDVYLALRLKGRYDILVL